eukprot:82259-Chlamydomonas_euryale.AAC.4
MRPCLIHTQIHTDVHTPFKLRPQLLELSDGLAYTPHVHTASTPYPYPRPHPSTPRPQVLELGGDHVDAPLAHAMMRQLSQVDAAAQAEAASAFLPMLDRPKLPDMLLRVGGRFDGWCSGLVKLGRGAGWAVCVGRWGGWA